MQTVELEFPCLADPNHLYLRSLKTNDPSQAQIYEYMKYPYDSRKLY